MVLSVWWFGAAKSDHKHSSMVHEESTGWHSFPTTRIQTLAHKWCSRLAGAGSQRRSYWCDSMIIIFLHGDLKLPAMEGNRDGWGGVTLKPGSSSVFAQLSCALSWTTPSGWGLKGFSLFFFPIIISPVWASFFYFIFIFNFQSPPPRYILQKAITAMQAHPRQRYWPAICSQQQIQQFITAKQSAGWILWSAGTETTWGLARAISTE